jgi:RepB DNA-primase from phage plasmid
MSAFNTLKLGCVSREKRNIPDRTQEAVRRQVEAMGSERFEVGVFDASTERMIPRVWKRDTVLKSIAWLRYENLNGRNIYIRPAGEHHLSLVDDLKGVAIQKMKRDGFVPAVLVETSPGNFQAWLNHGKQLQRSLSTAVAKSLAAEFHGDLGSADWRHFGRLAGFTNRKEKYRQPDGDFPYVLLREASGSTYAKAPEFVAEVEVKIRNEIAEAARQRDQFRKTPRRTGEHLKDIDRFRSDPKYSGAHSRSDLAYAVYSLDHDVPENEVRARIASQALSYLGSPARQRDYIERIIRKATEHLSRATTGEINRNAKRN